MNKPKMDLSKEGMQSFFLHHVEKVIMVVAVAALGVFFWMGFQNKPYDEKTPTDLSQLASRAGTHINDGSSWDKISEMRLGDDKADERLANARRLDTTGYEKGRISGIALRSRMPRKDPKVDLSIPLNDAFEVAVLKAPILVKNDPPRDAYAGLDIVGQADSESKDRGRGGAFGPAGGEGSNDKSKKKDDETSIYGEELPETQRSDFVGVRPQAHGLSSESARTRVFNVVAIKGLVDIKAQWENYNEVFGNAFGYYPPRDKPIYKYVEVERREAGTDQWKPISELLRGFAENYATEAYEVINPKNYDEALTGDIPPMTLVDYRSFARHSKLGRRDFEEIDENGKPVDESQEDEVEGDIKDGSGNFLEDEPDDQPEDQDMEKKKKEMLARSASDRSRFDLMLESEEAPDQYKMFRFFDLIPKNGVEYEYRFRLWLDDPNNEPKSASAGKGNRRGRKDDRGNMSSGGFGGLDEGGQGGGREGGQGTKTKKKKEYQKVAIMDSWKDPQVRARISAGQDNPPTIRDLDEDGLPDIELEHARSTKWFSLPTTVKIPASSDSEFLAGRIVQKQSRLRDQGISIPTAEPIAELVTSVWSSKYNTRIPAHRAVRRGDVLNFKLSDPIHLLHPVEWSLRVLDDYTVKSDGVVVDISGGEKLALTRSMVEYNIPGEVLIMNLKDGSFSVRNNLQDKMDYRHALFRDDDESEFGQKKKSKNSGKEDGGGGV